MKQFFNMIPGKDRCCILLYGNIGEYEDVRSGDIARELIEAEAAYGEIDVRINSMGGDVYTGIAIFNALRQSKANITLYIDGVAASMASAIAGCGKPLKMGKYSRLMLHRIQGGAYGDVQEMKDCIAEMEDLEKDLISMYSERSGMSKDEIRAKFFDGKEHWLRAEEALALGFIDEIYDADPVPEDSTPEQIYKFYENKRLNPKQISMLNELKKRPSFAAFANEEDALRHIDAMEEKARRADTLEAEVKTLKEENDGYKAKAQEAIDQEITNLLDEAETDERINKTNRPHYEAALRSNLESGRAILNNLPKKRRVMNNLGGGNLGEQTPWEKRQEEIRVRNERK